MQKYYVVGRRPAERYLSARWEPKQDCRCAPGRTACGWQGVHVPWRWGPPFRPPASRKAPFGNQHAETPWQHHAALLLFPPFFLPSSFFILPPGSLFPLEKQGSQPQLISKNSRLIRFLPPQIDRGGQEHPGSVNGIVFGGVFVSVVKQCWATMEGCGAVGGVVGAMQRWW